MKVMTMNFENEITIEVDTTKEELEKILEENNFKIKEQYDLIDIYMLQNDVQINNNYLEILKKCLIIRNIITDTKNKKQITYKYKEYNNNGEIIKQRKIDCSINSIEEAINLLEAIGYHRLIEINDHIVVYANDITEFAVQYVNNKHIYIEIKDKCNYIDRYYESIEEMKEDINKYNIPIKNNDYFVKKAEIELKEKIN